MSDELPAAGVIDPLALLDPKDLARLCKTGEDWIRKGVAARALPWTRLAGQIRFTRAQAEAIIASHAVEVAHVPTRDQVAERRAAVTQPQRSAS